VDNGISTADDAARKLGVSKATLYRRARMWTPTWLVWASYLFSMKA